MRFNVGAEQFRLGTWRGDPRIGYVVPLSTPERLSENAVARAVQRLAAQGFDRVITSALTAAEQSVFERSGFTVHERLHLLVHRLAQLPDQPAGAHIRRGGRRHRNRVLAVDAASFEPFWRLDAAALAEAIKATPVARLRIAVDRRQVIGYCVSGFAEGHGYLQRLAVTPQAAGRWVGSALVVDSLRWFKRLGAHEVSVNTQQDNERALALYLRLGFEAVPPGLVVCEREIHP